MNALQGRKGRACYVLASLAGLYRSKAGRWGSLEKARRYTRQEMRAGVNAPGGLWLTQSDAVMIEHGDGRRRPR